MKTKTLPSIRGRLVQSLLWTALAFAALTAVVVWHVISHEMGELMDHELQEAAEIFQSAMGNQTDAPLASPGADPQLAYEKHLVWQVVDGATGAVVRASHKAPAQALLGAPTAAVVWTADGNWRAFTSPLRHSPGHFLVVAQSRSERNEVHEEAVLYTLMAALSVSLLSTLLMNWRIQQELRPLGLLSRSVLAYDPLQPGTLPRTEPRQELVPIEQSIGELGRRLARRIVSERAFTSHAAHALRTPVAGIDVQLALAAREAPDAIRPRLERARSAATRLGRVMHALLTMFRSGAEPQRQDIDLGELVNDLAFHDLSVSVRQNAPLAADADLLAAALWNLLDNSQRFHARHVRVTAESEGADVVLRVQDDGDGCPPDTRTRLQQSLDRQTYGEDSALRGLGLVLADLVARAHGGRTVLADSTPGFCVELRWPAERAPSTRPATAPENDNNLFQ